MFFVFDMSLERPKRRCDTPRPRSWNSCKRPTVRPRPAKTLQKRLKQNVFIFLQVFFQLFFTFFLNITFFFVLKSFKSYPNCCLSYYFDVEYFMNRWLHQSNKFGWSQLTKSTPCRLFSGGEEFAGLVYMVCDLGRRSTANICDCKITSNWKNLNN